MSDEEKPTYSMAYECINCGAVTILKIPKGEPAPQVPDELECHYCGCAYFRYPRRPKLSDYNVDS